MRSMLVIGLGRFGLNLAQSLVKLGNEVVVVDENEEKVNSIAPYVTGAYIGKCTNVEVLDGLGINNFDMCFVCISEDFQSSLEITSLIKEKGAQIVVSKADRDIHAKLLKKIGADIVIYPEKDMAQKAAVRYSSPFVVDYFEVMDDYGMFEIETPKSWIGKTIKEVNVRAKYNLNIIGVKEKFNINPVDPDHHFQKEQHLLVIGKNTDVIKSIE
ncbi:MAG: TrkA family potassium uptake protein [Clostridia bacterium]|nr:TrkA family potassium uptake protein [Clostridia bacterium]